jgi:hypothetical protein
MNEELALYTKKDKLKIYLYLLSNNNTNNALYYLTKEDIINLMKCSKYIYSFINDKNLLLRNLIKNNELQ